MAEGIDLTQDDLNRATSGLFPHEQGRPLRAGIVSVCPKCSAYVMDRRAHRKWHRRFRPLTKKDTE